MDDRVQAFLDHLRLERNASVHTLKAYSEDLVALLSFLGSSRESKRAELHDIATTRLRAYLVHLHELGLSKRTIARRLSSLRSFIKFLRRHGLVQKNPALGLRTPKQGSQLPSVLDPKQVQQLLEAPNAQSRLGCRDRAILETFYSTGLRVSELVGMNLNDLNLDDATVTIRGKGKRERIAGLGSLAGGALRRWLEVRGRVDGARRIDRAAVFVNHLGGRITTRSVGRILQKSLRQAGITTA